MYAFIDQPVDRLGRGSGFILWAMRVWTHATARRNCAPATLAPAFAKMGSLAALGDFHVAMALLNASALEEIGFAPMAHRRIAEGEAIMLALWLDVAGAYMAAARETLALMVDDGAVDPIVAAMELVVTKLETMDLLPSGFSTDAEQGARR